MKKIAKLIVTDLDDTLLKTDKSISEYTKKVINDLRKTGVKFAFSTARGESVRDVIKEGIFDAYSLLNGAIGFAEGKCIFENLIEAEVFGPYLRELSKNNVKIGAEINNIHYTNFNAKEEWSGIGENIITDFSEIQGSAGKLYAVAKSEVDCRMIYSLLPKSLYIRMSRDGLAMIMSENATKSRSLKLIAEHFGVRNDEVIAFGDDLNDIDMLSAAGVGVAMENAVPEVKRIADDICGSNEEDGLARWIEENLLR